MVDQLHEQRSILVAGRDHQQRQSVSLTWHVVEYIITVLFGPSDGWLEECIGTYVETALASNR